MDDPRAAAQAAVAMVTAMSAGLDDDAYDVLVRLDRESAQALVLIFARSVANIIGVLGDEGTNVLRRMGLEAEALPDAL